MAKKGKGKGDNRGGEGSPLTVPTLKKETTAPSKKGEQSTEAATLKKPVPASTSTGPSQESKVSVTTKVQKTPASPASKLPIPKPAPTGPGVSSRAQQSRPTPIKLPSAATRVTASSAAKGSPPLKSSKSVISPTTQIQSPLVVPSSTAAKGSLSASTKAPTTATKNLPAAATKQTASSASKSITSPGAKSQLPLSSTRPTTTQARNLPAAAIRQTAASVARAADAAKTEKGKLAAKGPTPKVPLTEIITSPAENSFTVEPLKRTPKTPKGTQAAASSSSNVPAVSSPLAQQTFPPIPETDAATTPTGPELNVTPATPSSKLPVAAGSTVTATLGNLSVPKIDKKERPLAAKNLMSMSAAEAEATFRPAPLTFGKKKPVDSSNLVPAGLFGRPAPETLQPAENSLPSLKRAEREVTQAVFDASPPRTEAVARQREKREAVRVEREAREEAERLAGEEEKEEKEKMKDATDEVDEANEDEHSNKFPLDQSSPPPSSPQTVQPASSANFSNLYRLNLRSDLLDYEKTRYPEGAPEEALVDSSRTVDTFEAILLRGTSDAASNYADLPSTETSPSRATEKDLDEDLPPSRSPNLDESPDFSSGYGGGSDHDGDDEAAQSPAGSPALSPSDAQQAGAAPRKPRNTTRPSFTSGDDASFQFSPVATGGFVTSPVTEGHTGTAAWPATQIQGTEVDLSGLADALDGDIDEPKEEGTEGSASMSISSGSSPISPKSGGGGDGGSGGGRGEGSGDSGGGGGGDGDGGGNVSGGGGGDGGGGPPSPTDDNSTPPTPPGNGDGNNSRGDDSDEDDEKKPSTEPRLTGPVHYPRLPPKFYKDPVLTGTESLWEPAVGPVATQTYDPSVPRNDAPIHGVHPAPARAGPTAAELEAKSWLLEQAAKEKEEAKKQGPVETTEDVLRLEALREKLLREGRKGYKKLPKTILDFRIWADDQPVDKDGRQEENIERAKKAVDDALSLGTSQTGEILAGKIEIRKLRDENAALRKNCGLELDLMTSEQKHKLLKKTDEVVKARDESIRWLQRELALANKKQVPESLHSALLEIVDLEKANIALFEERRTLANNLGDAEYGLKQAIEQLDLLQNDLKKALFEKTELEREVRDLKNKNGENDCSDFKAEIEGLKKEKGNTNEELSKTKEELNTLKRTMNDKTPLVESRKTLAEKEGIIAAASARIERLETEIEDFRGEVKSLKSQNEVMQAVVGHDDTAEYEEKIQQLEASSQLQQESNDAYNAASLEAQETIAQLQAEIEQLQDALNDAFDSKESAELHHRTLADDALIEELQLLVQKQADLIDNQDNALKILAEQTSAAVPEVAPGQEENMEMIRNLTGKIHEMAEEILKHQEIARGADPEDQDKQMNELQTDLYSARKDYAYAIAGVAGMRDEIKNLQDRIRELKSQLADRDAELEECKKHGDEKTEKIKELKEDLKRCEEVAYPKPQPGPESAEADDLRQILEKKRKVTEEFGALQARNEKQMKACKAEKKALREQIENLKRQAASLKSALSECEGKFDGIDEADRYTSRTPVTPEFQRYVKTPVTPGFQRYVESPDGSESEEEPVSAVGPEAKELAILRLQVYLFNIVQQRAIHGFQVGDDIFAQERAYKVFHWSEELKDVEYLARAHFWLGITLFYGDHLETAQGMFVEAQKLHVLPEPEAGYLGGWIERCGNQDGPAIDAKDYGGHSRNYIKRKNRQTQKRKSEFPSGNSERKRSKPAKKTTSGKGPIVELASETTSYFEEAKSEDSTKATSVGTADKGTAGAFSLGSRVREWISQSLPSQITYAFSEVEDSADDVPASPVDPAGVALPDTDGQTESE